MDIMIPIGLARNCIIFYEKRPNEIQIESELDSKT